MRTDEAHVTPIDLDLIAMGQASPEDVARVAAHGAGCPQCAARQAEHAARALHFRTTVFPRTSERMAAHRPRARWPWALGLVFPTAAGVLLLAHAHHAGPAPSEIPSATAEIGIKGTRPLQVFARRQRAEGSQAEVIKVKDGDFLAAGDALRFVLSPTGLPYLLIASVDGASQVSVYYPFAGEASARVDGKNTLSPPNSIVLDRAPGPERIFAIHSEKPIQASDVREALARLAAGGPTAIRAAQRLPIEETLQSTLLFEKDSHP